jgi:hypothetical protein
VKDALLLAIIEKAFEDTQSRSANIREEAWDFLYNEAYIYTSWILNRDITKEVWAGLIPYIIRNRLEDNHDATNRFDLEHRDVLLFRCPTQEHETSSVIEQPLTMEGAVV